MPISGRNMVLALAARAKAVVGQTITKDAWSINIAEVRALTGPLYHPIPLPVGAQALAIRLTLTIDGVDKITPTYTERVVDGTPIIAPWWCVLLAHEIHDLTNAQQLEYLKERLIVFAQTGP